MRAILVNEFGPIGSHSVETVAEPTIGDGEVLIENHAIGLNYPDALMLEGKYQKRPGRPFVPGRDCAGVVTAVGAGVTRCKPGDRVVAQVFTGAFGETVAAPEKRCFVLPEGVAFEDARGDDHPLRHGLGRRPHPRRGQGRPDGDGDGRRRRRRHRGGAAPEGARGDGPRRCVEPGKAALAKAMAPTALSTPMPRT